MVANSKFTDDYFISAAHVAMCMYICTYIHTYVCMCV